MPDTPEAIKSHFTSLGVMSLTAEDGADLGVELFSCNSCGSVVVVRKKHWEIHQAIPEIQLS